LALVWLTLFIDDGLNSMPVWIEDKRSVIIVAIFGVEAGSAVISPTMLEGGLIKGLDCSSGRCRESDMEAFPWDDHFTWPKLDRKLVAAAR
jgi:hypothetical protein